MDSEPAYLHHFESKMERGKENEKERVKMCQPLGTFRDVLTKRD
jgi:hypothetical protein